MVQGVGGFGKGVGALGWDFEVGRMRGVGREKFLTGMSCFYVRVMSCNR